MVRGPHIKWLAANSTPPAAPNSYMQRPIGVDADAVIAYEEILLEFEPRFIDLATTLNHTLVDTCWLGSEEESPRDHLTLQCFVNEDEYDVDLDFGNEDETEDDGTEESHPEGADEDFDITLCDLIDCTGLDINTTEPSTALVIISQPHGVTKGMIPFFALTHLFPSITIHSQ